MFDSQLSLDQIRNTMPVLQINGITKKYGRITAVNDLHLTINKGEIFGLLGPNGSGKTTTLGIVLGLIKANSGSYNWFDGSSNNNQNTKIGTILETPNFYPYMTAIENLELIAHIKKAGRENIEPTLELVDLIHRKNSRFHTYSLGMKQRLALAGALIGNPEFLILDEPTNGLDPQGISEVREIIQKIAHSGTTILMASHILDEVEKVCSHVAIIKKGKLLATGEVGSILSDQIQVELISDNNGKLLDLLDNRYEISGLNKSGEKIVFNIDANFSSGELNKLAFENGITISHLLTKKTSLEQEFLEITKNK